MKNLLCEHPAIILNPHLKDLILIHRNYTLRNIYHKVDDYLYSKWFYFFDYSNFGTRKLKITHDDLDSCYITDTITGELLPVYIEVPCNKCSLCREKASREWATRAMCESQTSTSLPLFVTLTYNDYSLPSDGVRKEHAQTFLKRLRVNVNRYFGYEVNLRFFLCSEYGSNTKRPHYHALIWNFPLTDNLKHTLSIIEKSWSLMITKEKYEALPSDFRLYDKEAKRYRQRIGFAYVSIANGSRIKYSMKYMRKDSEIPHNSNKLFFLSSRRRGLGYQWMKENADYYYDNPQMLDVHIVDKWSNEEYKGTLPNYFKQYLFPTLSKVLPKDIRDLFRHFNYKLNIYRKLLGPYCPKKYYSDDEQLIHKYRCIPFHRNTNVPKFYLTNLRCELNNDVTFEDDFNCYFKKLSSELEHIRKKLSDFKFDCSDYERIERIKDKRKYFIESFIQSLPPCEVHDAVNSLMRKRQRSKLRELL